MKLTRWSVADAKSKLSEVLNRADKEAQVIRRRDREYVVMGAREYQKLRGQTRSFLDHIIDGGPKVDSLKPMPRRQDKLRELEL